MARRDEFDDEEGFLDTLLSGNRSEGGHPGTLRRLLAMAAGIGVLGILAAILWSTWPEGRGKNYNEADVPIIRADTTPYRVEPKDRGGMAVPNKDSTIFNTLKDSSDTPSRVENLFEEPEKPVRKDEFFAAETPTTTTPQPQPADRAAVGEDSPKKPIELKKTETAVAAKTAEALQPAAGGNFYVQLAAVKSELDAKAKWPKYQTQFPVLSGLELRIQKADLGARGVFYRVQGGPLSETDARKTCVAINSGKAGSCVVAKR